MNSKTRRFCLGKSNNFYKFREGVWRSFILSFADVVRRTSSPTKLLFIIIFTYGVLL